VPSSILQVQGCRAAVQPPAIPTVAEHRTGGTPEARAAERCDLPGRSRGAPQQSPRGAEGDRRGQHCIRINDQWRLCFHDVEVVDYH